MFDGPTLFFLGCAMLLLAGAIAFAFEMRSQRRAQRARETRPLTDAERVLAALKPFGFVRFLKPADAAALAGLDTTPIAFALSCETLDEHMLVVGVTESGDSLRIVTATRAEPHGEWRRSTAVVTRAELESRLVALLA